jgi:hypothetical protein
MVAARDAAAAVTKQWAVLAPLTRVQQPDLERRIRNAEDVGAR